MSNKAALLIAALAIACGPAKTGPDAPQSPLPDAEAEPKPTPEPPALPLHLIGAVRVPDQGELAFFVLIDGPADAPQGVLNIPSQGGQDVPLTDVSVTGEQVEFGVSSVAASWVGRFDGDSIECSFEQAGTTLECTMEAVDEERFAVARLPDRPQEPVAPFPYEVEEVTIEGEDVTLKGTLNLPPGDGHAALLLLSGSGAQDRDSTILGHKPFWVISDHMARNGIAVLRLDDRGVGGSTGDSKEATLSDLKDDAIRAIAFLKTRAPRIDPKKIGVLGHSEGATVAAAASAASKNIKFAVLLAGPGVDGGALIVNQVEALLGADGAPPAQVAEASRVQGEVVAAIQKHDDPEKARNAVAAIIDPSGSGGPALKAQIDSVLTPWFRAFLKHDPTVALKKLRIPVLALFASKDLQVTPALNEPAVSQALTKNKKATVETMQGLNHLFQTARTGSPSEYGGISETISPVVLERIHRFISEL